MKEMTMRAVAFTALAALAAARTPAAPASTPWPLWEAHDPASSIRVDHRPWDQFLARNLRPGHPSGVTRLAYGRVTAEDRAGLQAYVDALQKVPVSRLRRDEQKAYWINLYNALTVKLILDNYPVSSILKIEGGLFNRGPWDQALLSVEGQALSLNDVEHRILRPVWQDSRIHFAVNCASVGCPNLQPQAFTAENSDRILEEAAREYVNHPRGVRFEGPDLWLSRIFTWYGIDFGPDQRGILETLARHAEPGPAARLRAHQGRIRYAYDWSLNE